MHHLPNVYMENMAEFSKSIHVLSEYFTLRLRRRSLQYVSTYTVLAIYSVYNAINYSIFVTALVPYLTSTSITRPTPPSSQRVSFPHISSQHEQVTIHIL